MTTMSNHCPRSSFTDVRTFNRGAEIFYSLDRVVQSSKMITSGSVLTRLNLMRWLQFRPRANWQLTTSISVLECPMLQTMQPFFMRSRFSLTTTFLLPDEGRGHKEQRETLRKQKSPEEGKRLGCTWGFNQIRRCKGTEQVFWNLCTGGKRRRIALIAHDLITYRTTWTKLIRECNLV